MLEAPVMVVKVGSSTLTDERGELDLNYIRALSRQIAALLRGGWRVALVTSAAITAGRNRLGLPRTQQLRLLQAAAAVGQVALMRVYADCFRDHGVTVGQVLLTRGDIADRRRYLNARNTLLALLSHGVVPVINENDTVAVEEIRYGDNDQLAAQVVQLVGAELLVFLTDTDGFYVPTDHGRQLLGEVAEITADLEQAAGGSASGVGSGGMTTKLLAAKMATRVGCKVVMARGRGGDGAPPLERVVRGEAPGTTFLPAERALNGRKRWLAQSADAEGDLVIDDGAAKALVEGRKSLLAVGVREIRGEFEAGALVRVLDREGHELARGLTDYGSVEIERIKGLHSWEVAETLGYEADAEVVHRDNLAILDRPPRANGGDEA